MFTAAIAAALLAFAILLVLELLPATVTLTPAAQDLRKERRLAVIYHPFHQRSAIAKALSIIFYSLSIITLLLVAVSYFAE